VRCSEGVFFSIISAAGDVEVGELHDSVVICDGAVTVKDGPSRSLIVARGPVRCSGSFPIAGVVSSGGAVTFYTGLPRRDAFVARNERKHLGLLRFFEPEQVGVGVAPAKFAVRLSALDAKKAFAKAGLKEGDLVVSVDGSEVVTPKGFRRAVLRRLVEGGAAKLRVRRDGEWLTAFVTPRL
jgi:PDZ domain